MRKEPDERFDPSKPTLIVLYGATRKKFRLLEGDLVVIGRAAGCDIGLVSPEVAPVHCVIVRLGNGWRIRDCSGRATRVNGKSIHDEPLRNGDKIQVGTFSFEAHLPTTLMPIPTTQAGPVVDRLQRSRRRLVELLLSLRRRLQEQSHQLEEDQAELERHRADVEMMERRLRQMHQDHLAKQSQLGEREATLSQRVEELERYAAKAKVEADKMIQEAREQLATVEAELVAQRVEQNKETERLTLWQHDLQARQLELEATASQVDELLCRERDQLDNEKLQVAQEREALARDRQELHELRIELERARDVLSTQTPTPTSTRETKLETGPGDRLESARKLLRDLSSRRKPERAGSGSRTRQPRPSIEE